MSLESWANLATVFGGIAAIATVIIAWYQLSNLNKSLTASNLMTIFEIEFELNRRKERLSEIRKTNEEHLNKFKNIKPTNEEKDIIKLLDSHRKEAYENYLNVFDRLCFFVLKKRLDENDFKLEYRDMLFKTIQEDQERTFDTGTPFRNMVKLFNKWKDS